MSYNELRKGRWSESGHIYFVTMVTNERKPYFLDFFIARKLIQQIKLLHDDKQVYYLA